jgi:hypothetical protein
MPHYKHPGKQGCNCHLPSHKIFNPCKYRTGATQTSELFMFSASVLIIFIASLPAVVISCYSSHCKLLRFTFIHFCSIISNSVSVLFGLLCSSIQCLITRSFSVIFCSDTGISFQVCGSPYQQPSGKSINIIPQDNAIFCLSIGSESLLPS